jgi:hypothetical protein
VGKLNYCHYLKEVTKTKDLYSLKFLKY